MCTWLVIKHKNVKLLPEKKKKRIVLSVLLLWIYMHTIIGNTFQLMHGYTVLPIFPFFNPFKANVPFPFKKLENQVLKIILSILDDIINVYVWIYINIYETI